MADIEDHLKAVADPPANCPGVGSKDAGKANPCAGCPSQQYCSSGAAAQEKIQTAQDVADIARRLAPVKNILLVMSGKGGVGKSTIATLLARGLAAADPTSQVGLLDVDICGPSLLTTMGIAQEEVHQSAAGWSPIWVTDNLGVMTAGLLLDSLDDAIVWRGPRKNGLIKQFLRDVDWCQDQEHGLDFLIIDTPPGTSDEHLSLQQYLAGCVGKNLRGAVLVTTPQEIALLDVRKEFDFCRRTKIPVLGLVENMSLFICPKCRKSSVIFPASTGGAGKMAEDFSLPLLGRIPLDPLIGKSCDTGDADELLEQIQNMTAEGGDANAKDSPTAKALKDLIETIKKTIQANTSASVPS